MFETDHQSGRVVDQTELRTNQALTVVMLSVAFILNDWRLVAMQSVFIILTTLSLSIGPYILLYRWVLKPAGLLKPDGRNDNPEAHRFATSFGIVVSGMATYFLASGSEIVGWSLVWLIIVLGSVAFFGWCAGCFAYYMIQKLGVGGFFKHEPVMGSFPGARPPKQK